MDLPKPDSRVSLTGLFAGLYSNHVCVVPDATDEEILKACNDADDKIIPGSGKWDIVVRTEEDAKRAGVEFTPPGPCAECPPRIHMVIRSTRL